MKILTAVGAMMICASFPAAAQVGQCAGPITEVMDADARFIGASNESFRKGQDPLRTEPRSFFEGKVNEILSGPCGGQDTMLRQFPINLANETRLLNAKRGERPTSDQKWAIAQRERSIAMTKLAQCAWQAKSASCGSANFSGTGAGGSEIKPGSASPNPQVVPGPGTAQQNKQLDDAYVLARKHQADVDEARKGKPKLHKAGSVAHQCLKAQRGAVVNDCPYAVEYTYCVLRPAKDSWSEAFDCDKGRFGSWQVGAGPGKTSIMHFGGETTYWFACKYGETLSKPDGISPVDIEYQRGRGLLGRCGEWGSSARK
jgi:hypothetical protein